jgi:energy-coupling factor transporter ATP-binding protein EcfA2
MSQTQMPGTGRRFRVSLSFPGEHRAFAEAVAERLAPTLGRDRVLYDKYFEAEFARPDLDIYLQRLYHDDSELIAVFLCAEYERKEWCGLEWRAIRDVIKTRRTSSIMLLRFDATEIAGLFSTDGYVWIGDRNSDQVAELILERLVGDSTSRGHRKSSLSGENLGAVPLPARRPAEGSPYRGLLPFEARHARLFFGRSAVIAQLVKAVEERSFVALVGPSGSGKTSLVRAGLFPALNGSSLGGASELIAVLMTPGDRPFDRLATVLSQHWPGKEDQLTAAGILGKTLRSGEEGLLRSCEFLLRDKHYSARLVLIIDQFEQFLAWDEKSEAKSLFLSNLLRAAHAEASAAKIVIAVRKDLLHLVDAWPTLAAEIAQGKVELRPMDETEFRQAIFLPAQRSGLAIEPGLVDLLLRDVRGQAMSLPFLQHVLFELSGSDGTQTMTTKRYEEIGGVAGALKGWAEGVYARFGEAEQGLARRLFMRLVHLGDDIPDIRRRALRSDLPAAVDATESLDEVIYNFVEARLLVRDVAEGSNDWTVELAHDALLFAWPRLRQWIEDLRPTLIRIQALNNRATTWERLGKPEDSLLRGAELRELQSWLEGEMGLLSDVELAFLSASCTEQDQEEENQQAVAALPPVFDAINAVHKLTVLNRLAQRRPDQIKQLEQIFRGRLDFLAEAALRVAVESGDPIGKVLALALDREAHPTLIERLAVLLAGELYFLSLPLMEVGLVVNRKWIALLRALWPEPKGHQLAEVATANRWLGHWLGLSGLWEQAVEHHREAVDGFREVVENNPGKYEFRLAEALRDFATALRRVGGTEEALVILAESIAEMKSKEGKHDA